MHAHHGKKTKFFFLPHRQIFKGGHGHGPVTLNQGEFEIFQDFNAAEAITDEIFESQGIYHSRHQAVEKPRAGTRHQIDKIMPKGILSKRVSDAFLKGIFSEEAAAEHEAGIHHHFQVPKGFFGKVKHFVRKKIHGEEQIRFEEELGTDQHVDSVRAFTADKVLAGLNEAERLAVSEYLEGHGAQMPGVPSAIPKNMTGKSMPYVRRVLQLGAASPALVRQMREELEVNERRVFPPQELDPLFPTTKTLPPPTAIDRFLQFRRTELKQAHNEAITTIFDKQRLGNVMRTMQVEHPEIHKLVVEDILQSEALHAIEGTADVEALIYYLEHRLKTGTPAALEKELTGIKGKMYDEEEKAHAEGEHAEKDKAEAKKLEEAVEKVSGNYSKLDDLYAQAPSAGKELFNWRKNYKTQSERAPGNNNQNKGGQNLQHLTAMIKETTANKERMFREIRQLEETFLIDAAALQKLLKEKIPKADQDKITKLLEFVKNFVTEPPKRSDEQSLFGKTEPDKADDTYEHKIEDDSMRKAFNGFSPKDFKAMKGEIEENFSKGLKKKKKHTPFELLKYLMEGEAARRGLVANENRSIVAQIAAERIDSSARRKQVFRSGNLEREEWLMRKPLGRFAHWFKAKMGFGGIQEAKDLIDKIAGMEGKTVAFKGLPKGSTAAELINWIDSRNIPEEAIFEFAKKLEEAFKRFEKVGEHGTVQLFDEDAYSIEELTTLLINVRSVLRSRRYHFEARNKDGNKAKGIFEVIREKRRGEFDDEKSILEKVADKLGTWRFFASTGKLKEKFFEVLRNKTKEAKEQKLSHHDLEHSIDTSGLRTAYDALHTAMAAKEAADIAITSGKFMGKLGQKFGKGILKPVFWDYTIRPAGKYGIVEPVKWFVQNPVKGAAVGIAKAVAFPFVLAGSVVGGAWSWAVKPGKGGGGHAPAGGHH